MIDKNLPVIGSTELVSIGEYVDIPAKIDTGADTSAIWASDFFVDENGFLNFTLFGKSSPFYDGRVFKREDYKVAVVRSATGTEQIRYRIYMTLILGGKKIRALFNLSDRSKNNFPILIGRRTVSHKFIVDVSKRSVTISKNPKTKPLNAELKKDPVAFHNKYFPKKPKPKSF